MKATLALLACLFFIITGNTQPNKKFGIVKPEDFTINSPLIDSSTNAIILYNVGTCEFDGNDNGGFSILYTKHVRIKILTKNGYNVAAIKELLYTGRAYREETLENIKASTFNIENNVVVETKLDKSNIQTSKYSASFQEKTIVFPSVKVGSIIEYSYTIRSEYISHLYSWKFEAKYPCLYNEYTVAIPFIFNYIADLRENIHLEVSKREYEKSFMIGSSFQTSSYAGAVVTRGNVSETKWVAKNIPPYKDEPFLRSIDNCLSKIDFQLTEVRIPDQPIDYTFNTWEKAAKTLKENDYFGKDLYTNYSWLKTFTEQKTASIKDTLMKIKYIYEFVNENYFKTYDDGIFLSDNTKMKDIFNAKKGTEAELNMLFIAMLRSININAEPAILSTRDHGIANPYFPILNEYNYLISSVIYNNKEYILDVSVPYLGFNKLPLKCLNGYAKVITEKPYSYLLDYDTLKESHNVTASIYKNEDSPELNIDYEDELGYFNSLDFREKYYKKNIKEFEKVLSNQYLNDVTITNLSIDSLNQFDKPIKLSYIAHQPLNGELIYLNPLLNCAIKENPFNATERKHTIEKNYAENFTYDLNLIIPQGYKVEELPKSISVNLMEDMGSFNYKISSTQDIIQLNCSLSIRKASFPAEDYQYLRDFYSIIIKKMNEQIVFKKNK